jgi:hypothetical protein
VHQIASEHDVQLQVVTPDPVAAMQERFPIAAHRKVASGLTAPQTRKRTMVAIGG